MLSKKKAYLFDLDGTLADTMQDHLSAWRFACGQYGIALKESDYYPLEGVNVYKIAESILKQFSMSEQHASDMVNYKEAFYLRHHQFKLYPGVLECLSALKERSKKLAMVTAGRKARVYASVPKNVLDNFDVVVTGDDTVRGKPFPDPYLKAIECLGLEVDECLGIENAPIGVESVKNAGIDCYAIASTVSPEQLANADRVFPSFKVFSSHLLESVSS